MQPVVDVLKDLQNSRFLKQAPAQTLKRMANIVELMQLDAGTEVIHQGDLGSAMYLIGDGKLRVHDGDLFLTFLGRGELVGEMAALAGDTRTASVTTVEDTRL